MFTYFFAYLLCGIVIGFLGGLFGIGGGIIGIPALLFLFHLQNMPPSICMHMAIGTLFATAMIINLAAIYTHYCNRTILIPIFKRIVIGTMLGSLMGVILSYHLNSLYLQRLFGVFLLFIALQMLFDIKVKSNCELPNRKKVFVTTTLIGAVSGLLGIAGGILMVPYLNRYGIPTRNAIATSVACIVPVTFVGTCGYLLSSVSSIDGPLFHSGYIYWPAFLGISITGIVFAPLGAKVTRRLPTPWLKKFFALLLVTVGCAMLIKNT